MDDCIFCKIANKEIASSVVYEDDEIIAFKDLSPVAPIHYLFIPKKHIASNNDLMEEDSYLIGKIYLRIKELAEREGFDKSGYRIINNCGRDGLQSVFHIHFHVLAGCELNWP